MPTRTLPAASACLLLLGTLLSNASAAVTTPQNSIAANTTRAGTSITNTGYLDFITDEGTNGTETSNTVTATVTHVPAVLVTPDGGQTPTNPDGTPACGQTVIGVPGQNAVLTYQIQNISNGPDTYALNTLIGDPGAATPTTAVTYYQDDGDGVFNPQLDTNVSAVALDVGETATLFLTFPISAGEAGTTQFKLSPVAASGADPSVTDGGNVGCIDTQDLVGTELLDDNYKWTTAPAAVTTEHTLRNTGNVSLNAANLQLDQVRGLYPTTYRLGGQTTEFSSPQDALTAFGDLPMGDSVTLYVTQAIPAGEPNATVSQTRLFAYTPQISTPELQVLTPYDPSAFRVDEVTIQRGIGSIDKTQTLCTTQQGALNCVDAQTMYDNLDTYKQPLDVEPCSVIKYGLFARNAGDALLKQGRLRDLIPTDTTLVQVVPLFGGAALYRVDGGQWTPQEPSNVGGGSTIEIAADLDGDGAFTDADGIPAQSNRIGAALYLQVKGPNCAVPTGLPAESINNLPSL